jgi:cation diffusion facilitator CzcD-associated flavoprotein CzcO
MRECARGDDGIQRPPSRSCILLPIQRCAGGSRSSRLRPRIHLEHKLETLVIGAGPAGLAVAACLRKRGAPFVIVEQSMAVGSSWRGHYDRVHLHTDRAHSALPFLGFPAGTPRYPSREQVITYLERYAQYFQLVPRFGERVDTVRPSANESGRAHESRSSTWAPCNSSATD